MESRAVPSIPDPDRVLAEEVIALHTVLTRGIANETYIGFANESASGPELHLASSVMALAFNRGFKSERHIYLDMLDKLRWGELFIHYSDGRDLTHRSLASRCYPMTFEELRPGLVRGEGADRNFECRQLRLAWQSSPPPGSRV